MAVIEYDEYKQKLQALEPTLGELEKALGIPKDRQELKDLQAETEQDGFWNNIEHSQKVSQQIKRLEHRIRKYDRLVSEWEDTVTLCEMAQEEDDASLLPEVTAGYDNLEKEISERRLAALLSGEYDANNAILTFHAGAGGTEAQDWTEMLYRMYTRWAERHGYTYQLMDYEAGDEAGIKSATILIEGDNAYGYLKSENGVHRLVRVSPFDANARRQTSFAAVEVMPELDDDSEIEIRPEDINEQMMSDAMYTAGQKDPDFILRPSGEKRLSNFMLWQAAYSELVEMDVLWPDFTRDDLDAAITEFNKRSRRFGGI